MRQKKPQDDERQYWLWVTKPDHYLDEDGNERENLEPRHYSDAGGWWTCSRNTKKGDFVFLWRARGACDIKYLIQADSDAYPLGDDEYASEMGWDWGCDYKPIYKFANSITITDLRSHQRLQDWNALKAQFRRRCMKISPDDWQRLNDLATQKNPRYKKFLKKVESVRIPKDILLEERLEDALVNNLRVFKKFGYSLELYYDKENGTSGRQFICAGAGGRIDLLCRNKKTKGYTIVELKNVRASRLTFAQICEYLAYARDRFGKKTKVDGIVVSRGYDTSFQQSIKMLPGQIKHIDLKDLGFE
jgi:predicted RNA-binding protein with PUA-like domain